MASSTDYCIAKINLTKAPNQFVIIKSIWTESQVRFSIILLQHGEHSPSILNEYTGKVAIESLQETATHLEVPFESLLSESKSALSEENGMDDFSYELIGKEFKWCKVKKSGFKLVYGSVVLQTEHDLCVNLLLDSLRLNAELKAKYVKTRLDLDKTKILNSEMQKVYETYVDEQKSIERSNLTKFVALLNEKKMKISQLESGLKNLKQYDDDDDDNDNYGGNSPIASTSWATTENNNEIGVTSKNVNGAMAAGGSANNQTVNTAQSGMEIDSIVAMRLPKRAKMSNNIEKTQIKQVTPMPSTSTKHSTPDLSDYDRDTEELCADM